MASSRVETLGTSRSAGERRPVCLCSLSRGKQADWAMDGSGFDGRSGRAGRMKGGHLYFVGSGFYPVLHVAHFKCRIGVYVQVHPYLPAGERVCGADILDDRVS